MAAASAKRSGNDSDTDASGVEGEKAALDSRADLAEPPFRAERSESSDDECENDDDECNDEFGEDAPDAEQSQNTRIAKKKDMHMRKKNRN